ncbi:MAG TPA: ester cyclase [Pseudonocardiaceae bacterium]|jgi:predicted ester cyclase
MDVKEIVKRFYDNWNKKDKEAYLADCSDSLEITAPGGLLLRGLSGAEMYWEGWCGAFPDNQQIMPTIVGVGDQAAAEGVFEGTHTGTLHAPDGTEISPTDRHISGQFSEFFVVRDDKIVSVHLYYDQLDLLTQLGLMPTSDAA